MSFNVRQRPHQANLASERANRVGTRPAHTPALEKLEKGGTLALAGICMTPIPELDYERHVFYERDVRSVTCNTRDDGRNLLAEAAEIPIRPHTTEYPLDEANRALQDLKGDRINGTGVLVVGKDEG